MSPKTRHTLISIVLTFCLILAAQPAGAQDGEGPVYVVRAGDTLSGIARTFGTSVEALMDVNDLQDPGALQPGQELLIPGFEGVSGTLETNSLRLGESLQALSWQSGVGLDDLVRLNRVLQPDRLYVGQGIVLPVAENNPRALPDGELKVVEAGETGLERAVSLGVNPWLPRLRRGDVSRLWLVPGELIPVAGGEGQDFGYLPDPVQKLEIEPVGAEQGATVVVRATVDPGPTLDGSLGEWNLNFVQANASEWIALQGVHAMAEPGLYDLSVRVVGENGSQSYGFEQPYPIRSGDYGFDPVLYVPEETIGPENTQPENERVNSIITQVSPIKHWEGRFAFPYDYFTDSFPSVFGTRRNYNNTGYDYYHTGLDFYGGVGVEILAPAPGEVVLADELIVRGKTTIIDHGWGVFTMYMHQSEIRVEVGDRVSTGDVIGSVGATGRVTGAHLHWEVRVGGIPVQPLDWVEQAYP